MSTLEIKGGLYEMISKVNDEKLLMKLYELIADIVTQNLSDTDYWDELSDNQKEELENAIQESYDNTNLVEHEIVINKYKRWLRHGTARSRDRQAVPKAVITKS